MKNFKGKRLVSSMLVLVMSLSFVMPVCAKESGHKEIIVSEEYAKSQQGLRRYGESEKVTVVNTEYHTCTVTPTGQPSNGTRLSSGGSIYVNENKGPTISLSFSLSWKAISLGVSVGETSTTDTIGYVLTVPSTSHYYLAKLDKTYKFERHKVDVYQYGQYSYTYYTDVASHYSTNAYLVQV